MTTPKKIPTPPAPPKDLAYYLTCFKLEGHTTWRIHLGTDKDSFERTEKANWPKGKYQPKVTELKVMRFDRITGVIDKIGFLLNPEK